MHAIPCRDRYHICVPTVEQFAEYDRASHRQLSLKAAIWDVSALHSPCEGTELADFNGQTTIPSVTIDGLRIQDHDPDGSVSQHVFKHRLRAHLPLLRPRLQEILESAMLNELVGKNLDGGRNSTASNEHASIQS